MTGQLAPVRSAERPSKPAFAVRSFDRDYYLIALGLIAVIGVWLPPIRSSLWLDETGAAWVIQGGSFGEVLDRGLHFQGQFPLYHILLWGWSQVAGTSELALRLPSVVAGLVAAWLCYRLALRLFGDVTMARVATCVFVMTPAIAFAAVDARPYALALAALLGSTLALARWLESGKPRDGVVYLLLAALTLYLHYLFALALVAHALWAWSQLRRRGRHAGVPIALSAGALALLILPTLPHFIEVYQRREAMSLLTLGAFPHLLGWVAPPMLVIALIAGSLVRPRDDVPRAAAVQVPRSLLLFLCAWLIVPPLTLYVQESVSGVGLYAERHLLSSAPAWAFLAAVVLAPLSSTRQRVALVVLASLFVYSYGGADHVLGYARTDWRGAAEIMNALTEGPETPILVWTGLAESRGVDRVADEGWSGLLLAPLAAYPVEGRPYPLPYELTDRAKGYVQGVLDEAAGADRILLLTAQIDATYDVWLEERTSLLGYTGRQVGDFGYLRVLVFERSVRRVGGTLAPGVR